MKFPVLILFSVISFSWLAGQTAERRVIVENGTYYYTSIHDEFQLATLHTGKYDQPLRAQTRLAFPGGRNYNDPIIPFAWDKSGHDIYAVNFLEHPLNDRMEAIKRIPASQLLPWGGDVTIMSMLMASAETNMLAWNEPYHNVVSRSGTLQHFFFDIASMADGSLSMVITNQGEMMLWTWKEGKWSHGNAIPWAGENFFTLLEHRGLLYLLSHEGRLFEVKPDALTPVPDRMLPADLSQGVLVELRDENRVVFLRHDQLDTDISLQTLIQEKATVLLK